MIPLLVPYFLTPDLEFFTLTDQANMFFQLRVLPQFLGQQDSAAAIQLQIVGMTDQQVFDPLRHWIEAGEGFYLRFDLFPFGNRIEQKAANQA